MPTKSSRSAAARERNHTVIRTAMRRRDVVLAFLLCLPFIFLFTRLPPPELAPECLSRVIVGYWARFVHVCDSYTMTQAMMELPRYFLEPNWWRGRPVYIVGGEAIAA